MKRAWAAMVTTTLAMTLASACGSSSEGGTPDSGAPADAAKDSKTDRDAALTNDAAGHADVETHETGSHPDAHTAPDGGPPSCASMGYATEVFHDDFDGTTLDTSLWEISAGAADPKNGSFTQITNMLSQNVSVSGGLLRLVTKRQCTDPWTDPSAPAHPAMCTPGPNYYSGAWIKANFTKEMLAPKGAMIFSAELPKPEPGTWPALWARNTDVNGYGEFDLIEQWYDSPAGTINNPDDFSATTHFGSGSTPVWQTSKNQVGPFSHLDTGFHVWAVEWDSTVSPSTVRYYYGNTPGTAPTLLKTVTYETPGLSGNITSAEFTSALNDSWRPYIDVGVSPADEWHESPDSAATFDTEELDVDWVVMCKP